ncbi:hypothetical protein RUND412_009702, partial [Rhizina undulata]
TTPHLIQQTPSPKSSSVHPLATVAISVQHKKDYLEELHRDKQEEQKLTFIQRLTQVTSLCKGKVFNLTKLTQFQRCMLHPHKEEKVFENNQLSNLNKRKKDVHYSTLLNTIGTTPPIPIAKKQKPQVLDNAEFASTLQHSKHQRTKKVHWQDTTVKYPTETIFEQSLELPRRTGLSAFSYLDGRDNYEFVDPNDEDSVYPDPLYYDDSS